MSDNFMDGIWLVVGVALFFLVVPKLLRLRIWRSLVVACCVGVFVESGRAQLIATYNFEEGSVLAHASPSSDPSPNGQGTWGDVLYMQPVLAANTDPSAGVPLHPASVAGDLYFTQFDNVWVGTAQVGWFYQADITGGGQISKQATPYFYPLKVVFTDGADGSRTCVATWNGTDYPLHGNAGDVQSSYIWAWATAGVHGSGLNASGGFGGPSSFFDGLSPLFSDTSQTRTPLDQYSYTNGYSVLKGYLLFSTPGGDNEKFGPTTQPSTMPTTQPITSQVATNGAQWIIGGGVNDLNSVLGQLWNTFGPNNPNAGFPADPSELDESLPEDFAVRSFDMTKGVSVTSVSNLFMANVQTFSDGTQSTWSSHITNLGLGWAGLVQTFFQAWYNQYTTFPKLFAFVRVLNTFLVCLWCFRSCCGMVGWALNMRDPDELTPAPAKMELYMAWYE